MSGWRTSENATTGGIGILNKHAYNNLINVNLVSNRILLANFNGNPQTSIIVWYSPTNVSDQIEIDNFYQTLNSVTR